MIASVLLAPTLAAPASSLPRFGCKIMGESFTGSANGYNYWSIAFRLANNGTQLAHIEGDWTNVNGGTSGFDLLAYVPAHRSLTFRRVVGLGPSNSLRFKRLSCKGTTPKTLPSLQCLVAGWAFAGVTAQGTAIFNLRVGLSNFEARGHVIVSVWKFVFAEQFTEQRSVVAHGYGVSAPKAVYGASQGPLHLQRCYAKK